MPEAAAREGAGEHGGLALRHVPRAVDLVERAHPRRLAEGLRDQERSPVAQTHQVEHGLLHPAPAARQPRLIVSLEAGVGVPHARRRAYPKILRVLHVGRDGLDRRLLLGEHAERLLGCRARDCLRNRNIIHPHPSVGDRREEVRLGAQYRLLVAERALRRRRVLGGRASSVLRGVALTVGVPVLLGAEDRLAGDGLPENRLHRFQVRALGVRLGISEPLVRHEVEALAAVLARKVDGHDETLGGQGVVRLEPRELEEIAHPHGVERKARLRLDRRIGRRVRARRDGGHLGALGGCLLGGFGHSRAASYLLEKQQHWLN